VPDVTLEYSDCPLGCDAGSELVVQGRDRELGLPGLFTVVRCRGCGLRRTDPRPDRLSMGSFYPPEYAPYAAPTLSAGSGKSGRVGTFARRAVRFKDSDVPPMEPGRALEIGCAGGAYLERLRSDGWEVSGVEFSPEAAAAARSRDFSVEVGPIETAELPREPVDLVVAWMVLEHLHDPVGALRRLKAVTRPGGWLACSVPNAASLERRVFGQHWYSLALPRHLHHFDPGSLSRVLSAAGWTVIRVQHQRILLNLMASLGLVLEGRRGPVGAAGWRLATFPSRAHWFNVLAYPFAVVFAAFGQTGRMTVWARPNHSASSR